AVIDIDTAKGVPSATSIGSNAHALARYAALCQEAGIVPIVEPEVMMDGAHSIDTCYEVSKATLLKLYGELYA
ncbi:MAG: fructose-bisphosphate aldolase class I, partial [Mesorhizobium sp.]